MFRGKSMWVSKCAIAILVGGFLFASLSRAAMAAGVGDGSDDAIFLTKAVEREVVVFDRKHRLWEPTTGTISFAWSDQPFAVHIPWNVEVETLKTIPYMGAPVAQSISTKEYDLTFALRGLSFQENNQINVSNFCVLSSGLYRFDGEPLDIRLADGKPPYEGRILFSDRDTWADLPNLDARADSKPSKRHIRPMSKAAPGRVAFFFVLDPRSPQNRGNARPEYTPPYHWADAGIRHWPHWKEECSARMSVTIDVVDRKELPSDNPNLPPVRISYQETPRQIATKEADIQVRQNGWVIRKATPSIAGDWNAQVNNPASSDWAVRLQDLGTEVHGTSFTAGHRLVATTKQQDRSDYNMTVDVKIDVGLPSRIWDHMPSVGSCNVRQIAASAPIAAQRLDTGLLTGVYGARDWNAVILTGWYYNVTNPTGPPLLGYFFSGGVSTPDSIQGHLFDNDRFTEDPNTRLRTYRTEFPIAPLYGQALPTSWTAWTPIENHRLLTLDIRCTNYLLKDRSDLRQPISDSFPRRHVDFYATRLSEIVSNKVGVTVSDQAVAGPETEDDGYWDWIVRYDKEITPDCTKRINEAMTKLSALAGERKTLRYKWLDLLLVDAKAHESLRPTSSEGFFSAIGEAFDLTGRMPVRPTMTATELAVLAQGRRELETKIAAIRPQQEQIVREALRAKKEMLESAQLQEIRSRDLRPELNDTIEAQKDEYAALTLRLYEAAEWYEADGLPRVIEQYRFIADGDEDMRELMTAKMALARAENLDERLIVQASLPNGITANHPLIAESQAERIKALRAVDAVLRVNPKSKEALEMRQKIELYFIHEIAAKLEREKQLSMAAFRRYLSERGFNPDDPKGYCDIAWDFAHRWMGWIFTSHTGAIISRGLANEAVEAVEIQTMAAAKNQVALLAIRRLVRLGFPLPKIRDITVRELSTSLTLKTLDKKPLDPAKAARMCREIHEAFVELYDLNALAKRDLDAFVKYSSMAYYQIVNPEKGRLEFWSDFIYSPWGLFTWFSPFAVCKVNGKWALHGGEVSAALSLDKATKVERLTDVFAATIEASRLGQWFKNTGVGKGIIQRIVADQRLVGGMGAGMQLLNEAGHLAGVITVVCGVFYVAEELDIPGVTRLIEGIVVLGGVESVYGYLSRAGAPLRRALAQIDQVKMIIAQKRAALAEAMQRTAEVERRMAAVSGPRGMTARDIAEIEAILKRYPREYQFLEAPPLPQAGAQPARSSQAVTQPTPSSQAVTQPAPSQAVTQSAHPSQAVTKSAHPGANPESDVARAVTGAGVAVRAGNPAEAKRAIGAAKQLQQSMMKTLDEMYVKAEQAEKLLAEHGIEEVVVGRVALADASRKISEISNPEAMQLALLDQPLNLTGEFGLFIHHGDRALQKGDLATAKKLYTAAHEEAFTRGVDAELTLAEKRLALLKLGEDEIQKLAVRRASTPATAIPKITGSADDMTRHLNGPGAGRIKVLDESGVNPSFVCVGPNGEEYIFKVMQDTGRGMDECLAYDLWGGLNEVGPGAMYVKGLNAPEIVNNPRVMERLGQLTPPKEVQGVLVRRFKGVELGSLTEAEVMALKKELADIRAFRVFIGDTDGHYRNVLVMGEGKPAPIDFDYANIITKADSTGRARHYLRQLSRRCDDAEQLMTDCMQMRSLAESAGERPGPLYAWVDRLDSMLSYDDMAPMVKKIKDLCSRNNGEDLRRILEKIVPPEDLTRTFEALRERAKVLDKVLKKRFEQFGRVAIYRNKARPQIFDIVPMEDIREPLLLAA